MTNSRDGASDVGIQCYGWKCGSDRKVKHPSPPSSDRRCACPHDLAIGRERTRAVLSPVIDDGLVLRLTVIEGSMSEGGVSGSRSGTTFETAPDNRRIPRLGRLHPGTAGRSDPACARHRLRPVGQNGLVRTVPGRSSGRHVQHNADCDSHFLNRGFPVANDRAHRDSIKRRRFHQVDRHSNTN